jgi:two-component system sensor histidine kinase KdpD
VQTPAEAPTAIDAAIQRSLSEVLTLANQLGAMVFTFRGQDVVDTILRFAREYRVGRIVVGRSSLLSRWQRLLGKRTTVERLLEKSAGFSVTVVGKETGSGALSLAEVVQEDEIRSSKPDANARRIQLGRILKPADIVIWDAPVSREEVMRDLAKTVCQSQHKLDGKDVVAALQKREMEISTFLNEGIAVPHACMDSLPEIVVAFGVTKRGVKDAPSERPIEAVFMALYPSRLSPDYLKLMSASLRALQDRQVLRGLAAAKDAKEVLAVLREWERTTE